MEDRLMKEFIIKVDKKGRILIPSEIRKQLNIKSIVKITLGEGEMILRPIEDPLERIEKLVLKGTTDVEAEIRRLCGVVESELNKAT